MLGARPGNLSREQRQQRESRKAGIRKFAEKLSRAEKPAKDRDNGKRLFDNMKSQDEQLLQDFDTERLHKHRRLIEDRLLAFRSQVSSTSAAAEHAIYQ